MPPVAVLGEEAKGGRAGGEESKEQEGARGRGQGADRERAEQRGREQRRQRGVERTEDVLADDASVEGNLADHQVPAHTIRGD